MHKLYDNIKKELEKIEETGLNSGNLDTAYKLLNMGKNVKKIDRSPWIECDAMKKISIVDLIPQKRYF